MREAGRRSGYMPLSGTASGRPLMINSVSCRGHRQILLATFPRPKTAFPQLKSPFKATRRRNLSLKQVAQAAEFVTQLARVQAELRQERGVVVVIGVDLIGKLLRRLLGLVVLALALQQLDDLVLADVHARFPSRKEDDRELSRILPGVAYWPAVQARSACRAVRVGVGAGFFDLLLAYGLADFVLVGDLLGAQADPLHRNGFLFHHRTLGMKSDLVFCFGNVGAGRCRVTAGLGDRLPLHATFS